MILQVEEGRFTPYICLDPTNNHYDIRGKCFPENSKKFFEPIIEWIGDNLSGSNEVVLTIDLDYVSSSSNIGLILMFKKLLEVVGHENLSILWRYEDGDDEGLKTGEALSEALEFTFQYESYQEDY